MSEQATHFAIKQNLPFPNVPIYSHSELNEKQNQICDTAKQLNFGGYWTSAKLRDWLISRQRYWGAPIPIVHCPDCGSQPVPREQLPVLLPKVSHMPEKSSLLAHNAKWRDTTCPKCQGHAKRESDTIDTFVDSSWYFLRYLDPKNDKEMFSAEKAKRMTPVDLYIGGKEHATLHLYYARFVSHFLHSVGLLPEREPFKKLLVQGMVMGRSYRLKGTGQYLKENMIEIVGKNYTNYSGVYRSYSPLFWIDLKKNKAVTKDSRESVVISWEKMSKSKCNGVDPENLFKQYGIDTTRLLILADVAPTSHRQWNTSS